MFSGVLETPMQFIFVTSLSNKRYPFVAAGYYKMWKKERKVISFTDCKLKCPPSPLPNIGPSNLSFVRNRILQYVSLLVSKEDPCTSLRQDLLVMFAWLMYMC